MKVTLEQETNIMNATASGNRKTKIYFNQYQRKVYPKYRKRTLAHQTKVRDQSKLIVLSHYSGTDPPQCADIYGVHEEEGRPFTVYDALHLDHINNDGAKKRRLGLSGLNLHRYLIKNNFPLGYQVVCANCNQLKEGLRQEAKRSNAPSNVSAKKYRERIKYVVIAYYSHGLVRCANPYQIHSEGDPYLTDVRVLTIDHIDDFGGAHRREIGHRESGTFFYRWLIENKLPDGFQVLCMSCQWIKELRRRRTLRVGDSI